MNRKIEFIESYIKVGDADYKWNDNHGELVRCKDCRWCYDDGKGRALICTNDSMDADITPQFYCGFGERRSDADE